MQPKTGLTALRSKSDNVKAILEFLEESPKIENIRRLGKPNPHSTRPRTMLVTLKSIWDVQKILAKSKTLRIFEAWRVFLSPSLNAKDQDLERRILKKRWEFSTKP